MRRKKNWKKNPTLKNTGGELKKAIPSNPTSLKSGNGSFSGCLQK